MTVNVDLNEPEILQKLNNSRFGLFVSQEWKRIIDPYTPRDTGTMQDTARIKPWEIHYIQRYSSYVYYGRGYTFKKNNPYSTYEWDVAAANAGQLDKLSRILNLGLQSGLF